MALIVQSGFSVDQITQGGSGRRWGAGGNKSSPPLPSSAQHSLDIPESSASPACGVLHNERIRSPTRVEVDSSLYLESPDEVSPPPAKRISLFNYVLFVALANTSIIFVKKKLMNSNEEDFVDVLVFLSVINLGLALLYLTFPYIHSSVGSLWSALSKGRQQPPAEVAVPPSPQPPVHQPREREAPPPPYHIAVDSSTPPPSYFDIFDK